MRHMWHHSRQSSFSLREARLLGKVSSIEVFSTKAREVLTLAKEKPDDAEEKIEQIVEPMDTQERLLFLAQMKEQYAAFSPEVRAIIASHFAELVQTATGTALFTLKQEVDAMAQAVASTPQTTMQRIGGWFSKGWEKAKEAGNNVPWGDVALIGGVIGVGALLWKFGGRIFHGANDLRKKAPAAAKRGVANVALLGVLAVGGVAAALGITYLSGIAKEWQGKLKAVTGFAKSLDQQRKDLLKRLESALGPERDAIVAQLEDVTRALEEQEQKVVSTAVKLKDVVTNEENQKKATEELRDSAEIAKYKFLPSIVVKMVEGWHFGGLSDKSKARLLSHLITMSHGNGAKMRDVFAYKLSYVRYPPKDLETKIVHTPKDDTESLPNRKKAVQILLNFCHTHHDTLRTYLVERDDITEEEAQRRIQDMDIFVYIEEVLGSMTAVAGVLKSLDDGEGSFAERIERVDLKNIVAANESVRSHIYDFAHRNLGLNDESLREISPLRLLKLSFDTRMFGDNVTSAANADVPADAPAEVQLLSRIFKEIKTGDTYRYLIPAFHGIFPTNEGIPDDQLVQRYLLNRMSLDQALRLFLYRRMMDNGEGAGLFLLQMEIIKFIADEDEAILFKNKKARIIMRIAKKLATKSSQDLAQGWTDLGIPNLSPEMFDMAWHTLSMALNIGAKTLTTWATEYFNWGLAGVLENKKEAFAALTVTGVGYRWYVSQFMDPNRIKLNLQNWAGGKETDSGAVIVGRNIRRLGTPLFISQHPDIIKCSSSYTAIWNAIDEVEDLPLRKGLFELLRQASVSTHNNVRWMDLAAELRTIGAPGKAVTACQNFGHSWQLRSVLHRSLYKSAGIGLHSPVTKPITWGARLYNVVIDNTFERGIALMERSRRLRGAVKIPDKAQRLVRYGALLDTGTRVEHLLAFGADPEELLTLVKHLEVDDLRMVFISLPSEAQKAAHADILVKVTQGKTPAELAQAGMDLAETAKVMRQVNAADPGKFADAAIDALEGLAKDPDQLSTILYEISTVEDGTARLAKLRNYIDLVADDALLVRAGASPLDMIASGRSVDSMIGVCLDTADQGVRQGIMAELIAGGHGDKLVDLAEGRAANIGNDLVDELSEYDARASQFGDDLKAVIDYMDDVSEELVQRVTHFGTPIVTAEVIGEADIVAEWMKHPDIVHMMPKDPARQAQFKQAVERCTRIVQKPEDAVTLLNKASTYDILTSPKEEFDRVALLIDDIAKTAAKMAAMERVALFLARGQYLPAAATSTSVLKAVAKTPMSNPGELLTMIKKAPFIAENPDRLAKFIRWRGEWYSAGRMTRNMVRFGVGLEFAFFLVSMAEFQEAKEHVEQLRKELEESLKQAGYEKSGDEYKHPNGSGLLVKSLDDTINALDDPEQAMMYFQGSMAALSGGTLLIAPQLLMGPMGFALIGVQVVATAAVAYANQKTNRAAMRALPTPVVALLGTGKILKESEANVAASASNWLATDGLFEGAEDIHEKEQIRKKAYFAMFHRSLLATQATHPELYNAIVDYEEGEAHPAGRIDATTKTWAELYDEEGELYNEDYDAILRRVMAVCLFQSATNSRWEDVWKHALQSPYRIAKDALQGHATYGTDWDEFKHLRTDKGTLDWENVTQGDWEMASQQAVFLYGIHKMEKQALAARLAYNQAKEAFEKQYPLPPSQSSSAVNAKRKGDELHLSLLKEKADKKARHALFGRPLSAVLRSDGRSTIEVMLENMESQLDSAAAKHGSERSQMLEAGRIFDVALPEEFASDHLPNAVNISFLSYAAIEGTEVRNPNMFYSSFLHASQALEEQLQYVGHAMSAEPEACWFAQGSHYRLIQNYRLLLVQAPPEFDEGGKVRRAIESLDKRYWDTTHDYEYLQFRTEQIQRVYRVLRQNNQRLREFRWKYEKFKKAEQVVPVDNPYSPHGNVLPVGTPYMMWDVHNQREIHFTPRNTNGTYVQDKTKQDVRVTFSGAPGQTKTWDVSPDDVPGMHGTLECISSGEGKYNWRFTSSEGSKLYYYTVNDYGIEQPGMNREFAVVPPRTEILHPETRTYVHPHPTFFAALTLKSGEKKEVRFPPLKEGEAVGRDMGRISKADQDAVQEQLKQYGIDAERISRVNTDGLRTVAKQRAPGWMREDYGWEFAIDPESPVEHITFSSNRLEENDPYKEELSILPDYVATAELAKRMEHAPSSPIPIRAFDRVITFRQAESLVIDTQEFEMMLELADGRIVRGSHEFPEELQRYITFMPVAPQEVSSLEWMHGAWVQVRRRDARQWKLNFRNPSAIKNVIYNHPDSTHRTIVRFTSDGRAPRGGVEDTHESPIYAMDGDAFDRQRFLVGSLSLQRSPLSNFYFNPKGIGQYYTLPDGTVYWTGGRQADGTVVPSTLYTAKKDTNAPGGYRKVETGKVLEEKEYLFEPKAIQNPAERRTLSLQHERERRSTILKEAKALVPTLTKMSSGRYTDQETRCMYGFKSDGKFHRSWGYDRETYEYIPPAMLESGTWIEQEDPQKDFHIEDLNKRKKAA